MIDQQGRINQGQPLSCGGIGLIPLLVTGTLQSCWSVIIHHLFFVFFFLFHGFDLVKITVESISCDFWQSLAEGATETSKYLSLFPGSAYKTRSN